MYIYVHTNIQIGIIQENYVGSNNTKWNRLAIIIIDIQIDL